MGWLDELFTVSWVDALANRLKGRQATRLLGPGAPTAVDNPTLGTTDLTFPGGGGGGGVGRGGQFHVAMVDRLDSDLAFHDVPVIRICCPTAAFSVRCLTPLTSSPAP